MKHERHSRDEKPDGTRREAILNGNETEVEFTPSPEEVARRAYFAYVNEGSPQGRDVQHWLDAEAGLVKERSRTRTHQFHN